MHGSEIGQSLLQSQGVELGRTNPALFFHKSRNSRAAVHGDDVYVFEHKDATNHIGKVLASK